MIWNKYNSSQAGKAECLFAVCHGWFKCGTKPYKTHRRLLPLIMKGKSFKSQQCTFHFCPRKLPVSLPSVLQQKGGWRDHSGATGPTLFPWMDLFHLVQRMNMRLIMLRWKKSYLVYMMAWMFAPQQNWDWRSHLSSMWWLMLRFLQ